MSDLRISSTETSARVRSTLDTFYRAFAGEPDLLDQVVTPDWQDIPLAPGQGPGADGIKPMIRAFKQAIPDLAITVHDVIVDGDRVGVRAAMTGTHTGEWFGVAPTGRVFSIGLHEFHRIDRGRLTHTWHLEDWFGWLNQIGAWPVSKETAS
ncbi:ester cyclase [Aurantimonas sp. HBX-1]|uniref:ester cyclase n=1 Tax=Aurantimonas sp. HBX-1 TaxID=2906072 RepID=UPI001F4490FE|nr:ester cyclase [Aurantimonas sp. HBX-1]UIJ71115.1 ester cyclase [Aurantimonas sp. HBX-1]